MGIISSFACVLLTNPNLNSVKVHSIALNPVDSYVLKPPVPPGRVVGSDIAGTVDKVGEAVTQWKVGDRVAGLLQGGKF